MHFQLIHFYLFKVFWLQIFQKRLQKSGKSRIIKLSISTVCVAKLIIILNGITSVWWRINNLVHLNKLELHILSLSLTLYSPMNPSITLLLGNYHLGYKLHIKWYPCQPYDCGFYGNLSESKGAGSLCKSKQVEGCFFTSECVCCSSGVLH